MGEYPPETPPVEWENTDPNDYAWTKQAFEMLIQVPPALEAKLTMTSGVLSCSVTGACPRCGDPIAQTVVLSAVTATANDDEEAAIRAIEDPDAVTPVIVSCDCGGVHKGRPDGVTAGCGINFKLQLLLEK